MTNSNDLIRRGDAVRAAHENIDDPDDAINAIPAALDPDAVALMVQEAVQAEREACAVVADILEAEWWGEYKNIMSPHAYDPQYQGMSDGAGEVAAAIRNQPHDRTALDRMLAEAREKALLEAYDSLFKHPGFIHTISGQKFRAVKLEDAAEAILALIDKKEDTTNDQFE